jgi:hypothetical protein
MNDRAKSRSSPRAAASIVFACFSLFMWRIYGHVHWVVQKRPGPRPPEPLVFADIELVIAYLTLATLAVLWCVWSWMTESRLAAIIATLFTALAVAVVSTMSTHISP